MKKSFLFLGVIAMILTGCGDKHSGKPGAPTNSTAGSTNSGSLVTAPVDYLNTLVQADKSATKTLDVSYLNQAVQLFNTQEGRYPKDLQELVPNYVAKIPDAPYGYKIVYDAERGTVKVMNQ